MHGVRLALYKMRRTLLVLALLALLFFLIPY